MKTWYMRGTPPHPPTDLTLVVTHEGGRYGRTRVQAFDNTLGLVHTQFYEWSKWEGHCSGQLLMPDFVTAAERARAANTRPCGEWQCKGSHDECAKAGKCLLHTSGVSAAPDQTFSPSDADGDAP